MGVHDGKFTTELFDKKGVFPFYFKLMAYHKNLKKEALIKLNLSYLSYFFKLLNYLAPYWM